MKLTLEIEDQQFDIFLSFLKTLDYVSIEPETNVPQGQQEEVQRRLEAIERGQMPIQSWENAKKDIFKRP